jgi:hypothetical protein
MTPTTAQAFATFLDAIAPTAAQHADIAAKLSSTRGYLQAAFPSTSDLPLKRIILTGSAGRGTIVQPVDDIDVMAEFTNEDNVFERYRTDSSVFLERISTALNAKTALQQIGARGRAIRLFYMDGAHVDIAPTFKWSGSGFALPSGEGGWITTDPEAQATWYAERNAAFAGNLTPLVKLLRRWNTFHSERFEAYHLEVVCASMFSTLGANQRSALHGFFDAAPRHLSVSDPAGHSGQLDSDLSRKARQTLLAQLGEAARRADKALAAERAGDHAVAKRLWRIELGSEFPTS